MNRDLFNWDSGKSEGVTDHGNLDGLSDDDHSQYLNEARHDKTERHTLGDVVPHDTTKVGLSGNETIADIKTFSSIPVLPASDPTTDNQAVRKAYADGLISALSFAPKKIPFCRAYHNTTQSIPNGGIRTLSFNRERFDNNGMFSPTSTDITIKTAGIYLVGCCVYFSSNSSGLRALYIQVNNSYLINNVLNNGVSGAGVWLEAQSIWSFAVDDYVRAQVWQNSGSALNIESLGERSPEFYAVYLGSYS